MKKVEMAEVIETIDTNEARLLNGNECGTLIIGSCFPLSDVQYSETKILVETGAGPMIMPRNKVKIFDLPALTYEGNPNI